MDTICMFKVLILDIVCCCSCDQKWFIQSEVSSAADCEADGNDLAAVFVQIALCSFKKLVQLLKTETAIHTFRH